MCLAMMILRTRVYSMGLKAKSRMMVYMVPYILMLEMLVGVLVYHGGGYLV